MSRKPKYSPEQKVQACEDYLFGRKAAVQIARELDMGKAERAISGNGQKNIRPMVLLYLKKHIPISLIQDSLKRRW